MKSIGALLIVCVFLGFGAGTAGAELIGPYAITPAAASFSIGGPTAWVYPYDPLADPNNDNSDRWRFDLSSFSTPSVGVTLTVADQFYGGEYLPDNYDVYWDGSPLGNTLVPEGRTYVLSAASALHELEIRYVNFPLDDGYRPHPGGSYYVLTLNATPVPLPTALFLLGPGLVCLVILRRGLLR